MLQRYWTTPAGDYSNLYNDMLQQINLLVAGAAGSGKSTVENELIYTALYRSPAAIQFILIDPKGTELDEYRQLPHTIYYGQTAQECARGLEYGLNIARARFKDMKRQHRRMFDGSDVYIIIDELMHLMIKAKKQTLDTLTDIMTIARASRIHVIAISQNTTTITIPAILRCNFDSRLGLRTATAQDSRNVIGVKGCELLPAPQLTGRAQGYYMHSGLLELYDLEKTPDAERHRIIEFWERQRKPRLFA